MDYVRYDLRSYVLLLCCDFPVAFMFLGEKFDSGVVYRDSFPPSSDMSSCIQNIEGHGLDSHKIDSFC